MCVGGDGSRLVVKRLGETWCGVCGGRIKDDWHRMAWETCDCVADPRRIRDAFACVVRGER